jgi:hypothetical protein
MHNNEDLFLKIPTLSGLDAKKIIKDFGDINDNKWLENESVIIKELPSEYKLVDPFVKWLNEKHPFKMFLSYMLPNSLYDWHTDGVRGPVLNLLLSANDEESISHSVLVRNYEALNKRSAYASQSLPKNFVELKYEPQTYFIFNSQITHSVWNFNKIRYLITTIFEEKKDKLTYAQLKQEIKEFYDSV